MAIPLLNLDDRTFQDMMAEVQALIPRHVPVWTNRNLSDPGVTVLELFAWLTEAMLFRINRVPDASRQRFLELLGATFQPAQPAMLKLTVAAAVGSGEPPTLPRHTVVAVYPGFPHDAIPFETVDKTVFTNALPTRTVMVRQTSPTTVQTIGDGQLFPLVRLPAPMTLPATPYPRPPMVWVSDASDRVYWHHIPALRDAAADERCFAFRAGINAVIFGDGVHGLIPPSGTPITIVYRTSLEPQAVAHRQTLRSNGAPNQIVRLAAPLLPLDLQAPSDLAPSVTVAGRRWAYCASIFDFEPGAHAFTPEPWANGLRFGNDVRGKIPGVGTEIVATYRTTLGRIRNLPAQTSFVFDAEDAAAMTVKTFSVIDGGTAGTTLDEAREQAFSLLKTPWRSVTTTDFGAVLMRERQDIHKVQCLAGDDLRAPDVRQPAQIGVLVTPKPRYTLESATEMIGTPLLLDPTGCTLVAALANGSVHLWNLLTKRRVAVLSTSGVRHVNYSPNGARLMVVRQDGDTALFDTLSGARLFPPPGPEEPRCVTAISLMSPNGQRWFTVTAGEAGLADLRAGDDGMAFVRLPATSPITHAAFTRDGARLITAHAGGSDGGSNGGSGGALKPSMKVWDAKDGAAVVANIELDVAVRQLVNCEDGFSMAAIDVNGRVTVWNPAWRRKVLVVETGASLKMVQSDPTVTRLATITDAGSAQLWSLRTGELLASLAHPQPVAGAAFSPDGRRLATYDSGGNIRLWQTCSGSHELDLSAGAPITTLAFHRFDARLAVIAEPPLTAIVWGLAHAGRPLLQRDGATVTAGGGQFSSALKPPPITSAVLSGAGDWVAWTEKNLTTVWDVAQGRVVAAFHHSQEYTGLHLGQRGPNDNLVLTLMERKADAGKSRCVQVWDAGLVQAAQQLLAERHLLTSEVHVRGPSFVEIGVRAVLVRSLPPRQSLDDLAAATRRALLEFFDPLTGGPDKRGWPLGREVHISEVYQVMEQTPGIDHVESLCLFTPEGLADDVAPACLEHVPIPPHYLVNCVLNAASIQIIDPERVFFAVTV